MRTNTQNDILIRLSDDTLTLDDPGEDIRHRKVFDRNGKPIGHVTDLFVDHNERKVRMLQVAAGGFLGLGDRHFLVPVEAIKSVSTNEVHIDQARAKVIDSPAYDPKLNRMPFRETWSGYYSYYGFPPYWNPDYVNQTLPGVH